MINKKKVKKYFKEESVSFLYTKLEYGGLSNMSMDYPFFLKKVYINSSEALYQAMKFPDYPKIQKEIIMSRTAKESKLKSIYYKEFIRSDWEVVKLETMMWCLRVKLLKKWIEFGKLLHSTKDYYIVEESYKDNYWGANPRELFFIGGNMLGELLMELRSEYRKIGLNDYVILPPNIPNFKLYNCFATPICLKSEEKEKLLSDYKEKVSKRMTNKKLW